MIVQLIFRMSQIVLIKRNEKMSQKTTLFLSANPNFLSEVNTFFWPNCTVHAYKRTPSPKWSVAVIYSALVYNNGAYIKMFYINKFIKSRTTQSEDHLVTREMPRHLLFYLFDSCVWIVVVVQAKGRTLHRPSSGRPETVPDNRCTDDQRSNRHRVERRGTNTEER